MSTGINPTNILDQYWLKPDGTVFGSATQTSVATSDSAYLAWVARGNIATLYPGDAAMRALLAPYNIGLSSTETSSRDALAAITSRNWLNGSPTPTMVNGIIFISVSSGALTVSLKNIATNDPTVDDPVVIFIIDSAAGAYGLYDTTVVSAANSVTISSGSTLGAVNNVPFRLWLVALCDAGGCKLGLINCRIGGSGITTSIVTLNEFGYKSSTAEGGAGAADSAGVIYSNTAVSNLTFRVLGFLDWASGLTTVGTWVLPTTVRLYLPGMPRPGMPTGNVVYGETNTSSTTTSSTFVASNISASITPSAAMNMIRATAHGCGATGAANKSLYTELRRGTSVTVGVKDIVVFNNSQANMPITLTGFDFPGSVSAQTYAAYIASADNVTSCTFPQSSYGNPIGSMLLEEIMG